MTGFGNETDSLTSQSHAPLRAAQRVSVCVPGCRLKPQALHPLGFLFWSLA